MKRGLQVHRTSQSLPSSHRLGGITARKTRDERQFRSDATVRYIADRSMSDPVATAIDRLYDIRVRPPKAMHGCPCCVSTKMKHSLDRPRKLLTVEELGPYPSKAMTTWGTLEDYEHFLPRILELALRESPPRMGYDDHALASRLRMLDIDRRWSPEEREALETVLLVHWDRCHDIDVEEAFASEHYDWLGNFGGIVGGVDERLEEWRTSERPGARAALRHWREWDRAEGRGRPVPKGWSACLDPDVGGRVALWLRGLAGANAI